MSIGVKFIILEKLDFERELISLFFCSILEIRFIKFLAHRFFEGTEVSTAGIATYGYVPVLPININSALDRMAVTYEEFSKHLTPATQLRNTNEHSNTAQAIEYINLFKDLKGRANCLVFLSAQKKPKTLPRLFVTKEWKTVIAVGFDGADLRSILTSPQGIAMQVPYLFKDKDVRRVADTILKSF
ncbi:hypothetical protein RB195_020982 [Necator americanus]|uniref:Uncharacterized protein n=2 Tax=Necator americanus TaxID=51031 RepID=A0ABR1CMC7_NECAM